jgi:hypothetical protein
MFCVLRRRLFWRDPKPEGGCQAEAEHAQSAGRRNRPEAVSGRLKSKGLETIEGQYVSRPRNRVTSHGTCRCGYSATQVWLWIIDPEINNASQKVTITIVFRPKLRSAGKSK